MADEVQSNIKVNIDTASALASIKNLQSQISTFHASMAKSGAAANQVASQMQQTLINSVNATGKFSASMQTIKTTTESFTTALEKNKLSLTQYFRYAGASTKSFGSLFKTEFDTINKVARERVKDLQTQYIKMGRDANGAMKAIAVRPLMLDMDNLSTKTQIAAQRQQLLNQLLKQGSTNLLNFGKNTQWAGRQLMVGFSIPLLMAGSAAAKSYMQIEQASIKIRRVYGDLNTTAKETNAMVNQIKTLATEFTKYGVAVADTMDMAAQAAAMGKTGGDLLSQINNATKLSVLGGVDQSTALETTISLTNAFGISANQLSDKINFLNAVENQTVLNIEDMTTAIPKAAPVVRQLGGNVEDLAFFLTAMKEGGINASEGANALKSGLSALINPSKKASEFLMGFGVNVKQIVENDKGNLKKTVVDFAEALNKIDPLNRARAIEQMFGKFQFARISTLLQNVTDQGSQASKALSLANMSAIQRAAMAQQELRKLESSPMYKFQKAMADLQTKIAPIGEQFLKAVTPIISKVSEILNGFNGMSDGFKNFAVVSAAVVGGLAPILLMVFGLIANGAANIIKLFANIKSFFNGTASASTVLGEQTSYLTTEQLKAEAVAASLDQVHGKLTQTFSSEASAISQLVSVMERAAVAQNAFTGFVPGSAMPRKKFASGGFVPGSGNGDTVPSMLTPGEFVVKKSAVKRALPFLQALNGDNLPGYSDGGIVARAHASMPFEQGSAEWQSGVKLAGLEKLAQQFPSFIKVVSNLIVELPQKLNMGLIRGVSQEKFSAGWNSRSDKLKLSAILGGADMKDPASIEAGRLLEKEIHDRTIEIAKATADQKVNDDLLARATREVIEKYKMQSTAIGKVASALDVSSTQIGQVRIQAPTADIRSGLSDGKFAMGDNGKVMYDDIAIARQSQSNKNKFRPASSFNVGRNYSRATLEGFNTGLADAAKTASPSKRTKKIAKDTVDGYVIGLQEGQKQVSQSGVTLSESASTAAVTNQTRMQRLSQGIRNVRSGATTISGAKISGIGFGASMALGAASMIPGQVGQIAGAISPVVGVISMFGGAISRILPLLMGPLGIGIGAAALAFTGVSLIVNAVNDAKKKELAQINATTNAYKNANSARSEIEALTGTTLSANPLNNVKTAINASSAKQASDISIITGSEQFKTGSMSELVKNVKEMSSAQAKSFLTAYGIQLRAEGLDKQSTDSIMKSIQIASGKTNLKLSFASIDISTNAGMSNFKQSIAEDMARLKAASDAVAKKAKAEQAQVDKVKKKLQKSPYANANKLANDTATRSTKTSILNLNSDVVKKESKVLADFKTSFKTNMSSIVQMVGTGELSTKRYTQAVGQMKASMANLSPANMISLFSSVGGPKAGKASGMLDNLNQRLALMQMLMADPTGAANLVNDLNSGKPKLVKAAKAKLAKYDISSVVKDSKNWFGPDTTDNGGTDKNKPTDLLGDTKKAINDSKAKLFMQNQSWNAGFTDLLLGADAKTRKVYASIDNAGKVTLTGAGKKLKDAYDKKILTEFMTKQNELNNSFKSEMDTRAGLAKAGMSQAEATKYATDADVQAAYASAIAIKDAKLRAQAIKDIVDALKKKSDVETQTNQQKLHDDQVKNIEELKNQKIAYDKLVSAGMQATAAREAAADATRAETIASITNNDQLQEYIALQNQIAILTEQNKDPNQVIVDNAQKNIDVLQAQSATYQDALSLLQKQEDDINKTYDERIAALDKIQAANQDIADQQRGQLDLANALSRGDMAAAAKSVQDMRAKAQQDSVNTQKKLLDDARQAEIKALSISVKGQTMTIKTLTDKLKDLETQILKIKLEKVDPAAEALANQAAKSIINTAPIIQLPVAKTYTNANGFAYNSDPMSGGTQDSQFGSGTPWARAVAAYRSSGGIIPSYFASGNLVRGTDTVPAMLTPGEFIVSKHAVENFGVNNLRAINNGSSAGDSVYNYNLSVNMSGSTLNPNDVARVVMTQIKQIDSQRLRGNRI